MIESYKDRNKFKENKKSISLHKINPYYENKSHYLPYKYTDPSFKTKYKGLLIKKDLLILNLINNRINKKKLLLNNKDKLKNKTQIHNKLSPNIAITRELVLNTAELEKKKAKQDYYQYMTSLIKNKFFDFNPIKSKNKLIQYREYMKKNIPIYKGKERKINSHFYLNSFKQKLREQNYNSWKKLQSEYLQRENYDDKYLKTEYNFNYKVNPYFLKNNPKSPQKIFSMNNKNNKKVHFSFI